VVAIYVGALLFGGVLILASVLGAGDHPVDVHGADVTDPHAEGGGHAVVAALLSVRFWSFATAFFGLTSLLLRLVGGEALRAAAPVIGAGVGVVAGFVASTFFRRMTNASVGRVGDVGALVGREGKLLLPVTIRQPGKVRLPQAAGGSLDLVAESSDEEPLAAGADVIVVEVRGNIAVVSRAPGMRGARS
jgi:membrane protein implicated in regulation of membrane protease activity